MRSLNPLHIVVLLVASIAAPLVAQTASERAPRLVPWRAEQFFAGVVHPESTDAGMSFIIDAPMTTPQGNNYYGIGIRLRTISPAFFGLAWRRGGQQPDLPVELLGSASCDSRPGNIDVAQGALLALGAREGVRLTGRETPGAGEGPARARMDIGQPVFMYECPIDTVGTSSERHIRVLIPERQFQFGGQLVVTALYRPAQDPTPGGLPDLVPAPPEALVSDPLVLNFTRGRPKVLVVGDSVAWGQGIPTAQKVGIQIFVDMVRRYGGQTMSFTSKAHSGATVNRAGVMRIADVNPIDCLFQRDVDGEIPRAEPTTQCQIFDAVTRECFVEAGEIGVAPVPFFFCVDGLPRRGPRPSEVRFDFNLGPSYDVVILWACINDVGTTDIVAGLGTTAELAARTNTECDLRNGLADLREVLPNARIIVNEYPRVVSEATDIDRAGCGAAESRVVLATMSPNGAMAATFAANVGVARAGVRATTFRDDSSTALRAAVTSFNDFTPETRRGRGSVRFLSHPMFDAATTAMWGSRVPLVFPLVCNSEGILAAIDPVREGRIATCARLSSASAADPYRLADAPFMTCVRASAFHPTVAANNLMAQRIIARRRRFYPRMLNFRTNPVTLVNPRGEIP